jgi:hypothetical protein
VDRTDRTFLLSLETVAGAASTTLLFLLLKHWIHHLVYAFSAILSEANNFDVFSLDCCDTRASVVTLVSLSAQLARRLLLTLFHGIWACGI